MLRCVVSVVVLSACGRISFDPSTRVNDAQGDAPRLRTDAPLLDLEAGACPAAYVAFAGSCYRMSYKGSGGGASWLDAELACEADGVGSHLVVIGSETERVGLVGGVNVIDSTWIGTTKRQTAAYRTVIDTDAYLALGTQTEPSEDCLSINNGGLMYLHSCPDVRDYLCEFDGTAAVPSSY
jgi:hypothetical protein